MSLGLLLASKVDASRQNRCSVKHSLLHPAKLVSTISRGRVMAKKTTRKKGSRDSLKNSLLNFAKLVSENILHLRLVVHVLDVVESSHFLASEYVWVTCCLKYCLLCLFACITCSTSHSRGPSAGENGVRVLQIVFLVF
jgi:hypothetical protein